jgi:hypothetical protein
MAGGPLKPGFEWAATAPFGQILAKYNEGGVQAALDKARQILATAGQHAAMIARATTPSQTLPPNR